jgi:hypothetical protein
MKQIKLMFLFFVCISFLEIYGSQSNQLQLFISTSEYDFYGYKRLHQKPLIMHVYFKGNQNRWLSPIEIAVIGLQENTIKKLLTQAIATGEHLEMNKAFQIASQIEARTIDPKRKQQFNDIQLLLCASLVQDVSEPTVPLRSIILSKKRRNLTKTT